MEQIAILLATYNSEKYIYQQIESLLSQSYKNFILYIRDDGSSDNTLQIITQYAANHTNVVVLKDSIKGRRSMGSFMYLLENSDAAYYMFCDHDDVWLPSKVECSLREIQRIEKTAKPALVATDLLVVDEDLNIIKESFWSYMKLRPELLMKKKYAVSCNLFTGCTMIINQRTKECSLPISESATMHDSWIGQRVINAMGDISVISEPQIMYRQHGNNVCGAHQVGGRGYCFLKIKSIANILKQYFRNYRMARDAFDGEVTFWYFLYHRIVYLIRRR